MNLKDLTFDQVKELLTLAQEARAAAPAAPAPVETAAPAVSPKAVNVLTDEDRERIASVGVNTQGKDSPHAQAFRTFLRYGTDALSREQRSILVERRAPDGTVEKATIVEGTGANGGFLVPVEYSSEINEPLRRDSIMRRAEVAARVLTVTNAQSFKVPAQTDSAAAVLTAEGAATAQSEPTFAQVSFDPYKYTKTSRASEEMLEDSPIDVWSNVLQPDYVQAFAAAENTAFTTGSGSSQPQGAVTGSTLGVTAASGTAVTFDEVIDLFYALSDLHRSSAVWMMNDAYAKLLRKLKDSQGQYLWQPSLVAGQPDTIIGRPVVINPSMATPAVNAIGILFGNFRHLWLSDFGGGEIRVQRLNELYAANGEIGFRAYKRVDSNVMRGEAIKHLKQAAV